MTATPVGFDGVLDVAWRCRGPARRRWRAGGGTCPSRSRTGRRGGRRRDRGQAGVGEDRAGVAGLTREGRADHGRRRRRRSTSVLARPGAWSGEPCESSGWKVIWQSGLASLNWLMASSAPLRIGSPRPALSPVRAWKLAMVRPSQVTPPAAAVVAAPRGGGRRASGRCRSAGGRGGRTAAVVVVVAARRGQQGQTGRDGADAHEVLAHMGGTPPSHGLVRGPGWNA